MFPMQIGFTESKRQYNRGYGWRALGVFHSDYRQRSEPTLIDIRFWGTYIFYESEIPRHWYTKSVRFTLHLVLSQIQEYKSGNFIDHSSKYTQERNYTKLIIFKAREIKWRWRGNSKRPIFTVYWWPSVRHYIITNLLVGQGSGAQIHHFGVHANRKRGWLCRTSGRYVMCKGKYGRPAAI